MAGCGTVFNQQTTVDMEKTPTALMQAIQKLKDSHNYYVDESLKDTYTDFERTLLYIKSLALGEMISDFEGLLPLDREQIEEAWNDANGHSFYEYGSEYYTNTYTDEKG